MVKPSYAVLRVAALRSWSAVAAMSRHGRREGADVEHFDRTRSALNRHGSEWGDPRDIRACVEGVAAAQGARWRKNAPRASHLLLTASPEFFRPANPDASGTWDAERTERWLAANLNWLRHRWPGQVACWRLDLDESTVHLDVFLAPLTRYRTRGGREVVEVSHRSAFGFSRKAFSALQDEYGAEMAPLGLARGRPRTVTKAHHVNPSEYRRRLKVDAERAKAMRIGSAGLLRGDIAGLKVDAAGRVTASFHTRVPAGVRPRFLELIRPAGADLVVLQRRMSRLAGRQLRGMLETLVDAQRERDEAKQDRKDAADVLFDAGLELLELRRSGMTPPVGSEARIRDLAARLTRELL